MRIVTFKKTIAALLTVSSSLAWGAWELDAAALYIQPSFGGNGLGYTSYNNYAGANNEQTIYVNHGTDSMNNITPKWGFGFELEGNYVCDTGNDYNIHWSHLDNNVDNNLPFTSLFSGSVDGFFASRLEIATRWDTVYIEAGKRFNFNNQRLLRLHAGLEYSQIKNAFTNYPKLFISSAQPYFISKDTLTYKGLGPRGGIDFAYAFHNGISLYGKTAGSVLVGIAKQSISGYRDYFSTAYAANQIFGVNNYKLSNKNVVVPKLEAKLGVAYDKRLKLGNLGVDLGYLWIDYLNAVTSYTGTGAIFSSIGIPATSNFNLNGLYLGINWYE
jgi:hypothetical protein